MFVNAYVLNNVPSHLRKVVVYPHNEEWVLYVVTDSKEVIRKSYETSIGAKIQYSLHYHKMKQKTKWRQEPIQLSKLN
jgi:hypothetical protein